MQWRRLAVVLILLLPMTPAALALSEDSPFMLGSKIDLPAANWKVQNAALVAGSSAEISETNFDDSHWLAATVPGTVFTSYLNQHVVPDPYFGDQRFEIDDAFFTDHDFWYRETFSVSPRQTAGHLWLNFDGINWKADIFVNGSSVGRIDGAFIRGRFDITSFANFGQPNCLAVLIHKVAHPGKVKHKSLAHWEPNGGELGLDSPTFVSSIGWNWLPTIPGRNIGIWNDAWLKTTGDVTIDDPFVSTDLPLPDVSRADVRVQLDLVNHSDQSRQGTLRGTIGDIAFDQPFALGPKESRHLSLDPIRVINPKLWWPNGMGGQPMYKLDLSCEVAGAVSDTAHMPFGIRQVTYAVRDGSLFIFVNGHRVLIRGGNWGMDEGMLRCDAAGYDIRVRLHQQMNFNMIRNWVGMTGHDAFYDACDKYGILVWDDFWLANPTDGPDPIDHAMFIANARDKILRVRNHPSVALYCGRNEGDPPKDIDEALRVATADLDGTRKYISNSVAGIITGHGPYEVQSPDWYFAHRGNTMHSELGIVAVPPVESIRQMFPPQDQWPINDMWGGHDLSQQRGPAYLKRINDCYGPPTDLDDFCRKAQLVNFESAQAMLEAWQSRQGGGGLIWMTQAAWPCLICQAYAYDFEPTGAYFGFRKACEPIHILWDRHTNQIKVANDTINDLTGLTAQAAVYDLSGRRVWEGSAAVNVPATSAAECFPLAVPAGVSDVFFVKLSLKRGQTPLSENFYWAAKTADHCQSLSSLPQVTLTASAHAVFSASAATITATITNPSDSVAFSIRLKLLAAPSLRRILPALYGDNYFTLLPGETRTIPIEFDTGLLKAEQPRLEVEGWNIKPAAVPIQ